MPSKCHFLHKGNFERVNEKIISENSKKSETEVNKIYDIIPKEQCNINKHEQIGQFSYENNPWFINMKTIEVPENVQDLLRLSDKFCSPTFISKSNQTLEVMKELEKNMCKVPWNEREQLRVKFVNQADFYLSNRNQNSKFDNYISNFYEETKLFIKSNDKLIVTQADTANTTGPIKRCECNPC